MVAPRRTSRPRFTLGLIVLTAITLITIDYRANGGGITGDVRGAARTVLSPIGNAVGFALTPVGNVVGGVLDFGRVRHENARLRDQIAHDRSEVIAAENAKRELQTLQDQLNLDDPGSIPSVASRVIGSSPSVLQFTLDIDKGSNDGIARGMPVISGGALVGKIVRVTTSRSTVRLISDPTLSVGIQLSEAGDIGIATGDGSNLSISLIEPTTTLKKGDSLVTSGLQQSEYPAGIPVGTITSAKRDDSGLSQTVKAKPVVNLRRLSFVRVLQWSPE